jgi:hypothetical protein
MGVRRSASVLGSVVLAGAAVGVPTAAAAVHADVSLNPLPSQVVHRPFPVTGRLTHAGAARGKVIRILLQERGRWVVIAHRGPAANGQYRISLVADATGRFRIRAQAVYRHRVLDTSPVRLLTVVRPPTPPTPIPTPTPPPSRSTG